MTMKHMPEEDGGLPYTVRAKFIVKKVEYYNETSRLIVLHPVYSQDPNHENKTFWDATPQGELTMTINNPRAAEFFLIGQEYYLDFSHPPRLASMGIREAMRIDELIATGGRTPSDPSASVSTNSAGTNTFTIPGVTTTT